MNPRRIRLGLLTLLAAAAGTALVVGALAVLARPEMRWRWDLSRSGTAGLSPRTAEALASLPEGTRAVAFLMREDPRLTQNADIVYPRAFTRLRALLEDARIRSRGRLEVVVLEEFGSPVEWNRWAEELDREPLEVLILDLPDGGRRKFLFHELFLTTDPTRDGRPATLAEERVDAALGEAALRLAAGRSIRAAILTGSGQPRTDTEAGLRPFLRLIQAEGIDPVQVASLQEAGDCDLLVVPGQGRPLPVDESQALRDWLAAGKPLFLALGPAAPPEVAAAWNEQLAEAGIQLNEGLVSEARPQLGIPEGSNLVATLEIPPGQLSGQHGVTLSLTEAGRSLGLIAARPLALEGGSNAFLRTRLLLSAPEAWVDRDRDYAPGPNEARGTQTLAAAAERWESTEPREAGRVVVVGSAESLTGRFLPYAQDFVAGSLRWLLGQDTARSGLVSVGSTEFLPSRAVQIRITNLVTLVLPGFTLLGALLVYWRRRR